MKTRWHGPSDQSRYSPHSSRLKTRPSAGAPFNTRETRRKLSSIRFAERTLPNSGLYRPICGRLSTQIANKTAASEPPANEGRAGRKEKLPPSYSNFCCAGAAPLPLPIPRERVGVGVRPLVSTPSTPTFPCLLYTSPSPRDRQK